MRLRTLKNGGNKRNVSTLFYYVWDALNLETASMTNFLLKTLIKNFSYRFVWNSLALLCPRYSTALQWHD